MRKATALLIVVLVAVASPGSMRAQSPAAEPKFEVASLKPSPPSRSYDIQWGRNTWSSAGPKSLEYFLGLAFDTSPSLAVPGGVSDTSPYVGLPAWTRTEYYTIDAKAEDGVLLTRQELQPRLRQLLVERFKLATHMETTQTNGYALVLARGGPKLKETTNPPTRAALGNGRIRAPSITIETLTQGLAMVIQQRVVNETGLTGNYELTLTYAPDGALDSAEPSIFTALQDQLGLKLEGGRKISVKTLVIDHVERPTPD